MNEKPKKEITDLVLFACGGVQLHDEQDMMSNAYYSLSKQPRFTPITHHGIDKTGAAYMIQVQAHQDYGMATIYDFDIIMYAISHLVHAEKEGFKIPKTISITSYHLLKSMNRRAGGKEYNDLGMAFKRLQSTVITNSRIRNLKKRREIYQQFSFIQSFHIDQETHEITFSLCDWIMDSIIEKEILAISPEYFKIKGGVERHLYKIARKHAGNQPSGWWFSFDTIYKKCASTDLPRKFKSRLIKAAEKNQIPEYWLSLQTNHEGIEGLSFIRRDLLPPNHEGNIGIMSKRKKMSADKKKIST